MEKVLVKVDIGLDMATRTPVVLLTEVIGNRRMPIWIGGSEAQAISLELANIKLERPLTHDSWRNTIEHLGGILEEVVITEVINDTFYAVLSFKDHGEQDVRPSDAIALALRYQAPVYVSEEVMQKGSLSPPEEEGEGWKTSTPLPTPEETIPPPEEVAPTPEEQQSLPEPLSELEQKLNNFRAELKRAVEAENFEKAAELRDEIQRLTNN